MIGDDIKELEREFRVRLPESYVRAADGSVQREFPRCEVTQLEDSMEDVQYYNRVYREEGYYGRVWPREAFWIGSDGSGGAYFLMCDSGREAVFYIDWEDLEADFQNLEKLKIADSLEEYLKVTRRDMEELLAELGYEEE